MNKIIENPSITIKELNELEVHVKDNMAKAEDYKRIDDYLSFLGKKDFIIAKLRENYINSYDDFIHQRNKAKSQLLVSSPVNFLVGRVYSAISYLKNYISGKL